MYPGIDNIRASLVSKARCEDDMETRMYWINLTKLSLTEAPAKQNFSVHGTY